MLRAVRRRPGSDDVVANGGVECRGRIAVDGRDKQFCDRDIAQVVRQALQLGAKRACIKIWFVRQILRAVDLKLPV